MAASNIIKTVTMLAAFVSLGVYGSVANAGTLNCMSISSPKTNYGQVGYSIVNSGKSNAYLNYEMRPKAYSGGLCITVSINITGGEKFSRQACDYNGKRWTYTVPYKNKGYSISCQGTGKNYYPH